VAMLSANDNPATVPGVLQRLPVVPLVGLAVLLFLVAGLSSCVSNSAETRLPTLNESTVTGYWVGPWFEKPVLEDPMPYPEKELADFYAAYSLARTWEWPDQELGSILALILSRADEPTVIVWVSTELPPGRGLVRFVGQEEADDYRFRGEELVEAVIRLAGPRLSPIEKIVLDATHEWFPQTVDGSQGSVDMTKQNKTGSAPEEKLAVALSWIRSQPTEATSVSGTWTYGNGGKDARFDYADVLPSGDRIVSGPYWVLAVC